MKHPGGPGACCNPGGAAAHRAIVLLRRRQERFDIFLEQPDIVAVRTLHTAKRRCEQIQQESRIDQIPQLVAMGYDQLCGTVSQPEQLVETRQLQQLRRASSSPPQTAA